MIAAAHRVHRFDDTLDSPDCRVCRRPSKAVQRARWGCDAPTTAGKEVFRSSCTKCYGTEDECDVCHGSGVQDWERCPASQTDEWSMYVADVYENLRIEHNWPNGLPWAEQDNRLYCAVMLYGREVALISEAQAEAARARRD